MNFRLTASIVAVSMLLCANSGVGSQSPGQTSNTYTITDLGTLGGSASAANDINAAGQVVGGPILRPIPALTRSCGRTAS